MELKVVLLFAFNVKYSLLMFVYNLQILNIKSTKAYKNLQNDFLFFSLVKTLFAGDSMMDRPLIKLTFFSLWASVSKLHALKSSFLQG